MLAEREKQIGLEKGRKKKVCSYITEKKRGKGFNCSSPEVGGTRDRMGGNTSVPENENGGRNGGVREKGIRKIPERPFDCNRHHFKGPQSKNKDDEYGRGGKKSKIPKLKKLKMSGCFQRIT